MLQTVRLELSSHTDEVQNKNHFPTKKAVYTKTTTNTPVGNIMLKVTMKSVLNDS